MTSTPPVHRWVGVGVGAIVVRDGKLLLMRRANSHGEGTWSTPGGHVDFGETLEQCAARETLEETGVSITNVRFAGVTNDLMPSDDKHYVTVWMIGDWQAGEPTIAAADELSEVGWYDLQALPEPQFASLVNLRAGRALGAAPEIAEIVASSA